MSRLATLFHLAPNGLPVEGALAVPAARARPKDDSAKNRPRALAPGRGRGGARSGRTREPTDRVRGTCGSRSSRIRDHSPSAARSSTSGRRASTSPCESRCTARLVLSIKPFDPYEQRTKKVNGEDQKVREGVAPPAREAWSSHARRPPRARDRVQQLADMIDLPTTRARALIEDVTAGRAFFEGGGCSRRTTKSSSRCLRFLPDGAIIVLDDPTEITKCASRGARSAPPST